MSDLEGIFLPRKWHLPHARGKGCNIFFPVVDLRDAKDGREKVFGFCFTREGPDRSKVMAKSHRLRTLFLPLNVPCALYY